MTLADLIIACERGFVSVAIDKKREGIELSSGGNDVAGDANLRTEPAALYATEALALAAWQAEFERVSVRGGALIWIEKPHVETYRITLGDSAGSYRVVRDRYVVRGRVEFEKANVEDTHMYDFGTMECIVCGANRNEVLDNLKPAECAGRAPKFLKLRSDYDDRGLLTRAGYERQQNGPGEPYNSSGVALTSVEHPTGAAIAEDRELNADSIVTIEMEELKPATKPLKIEPEAKPS